MLLLVLLSLSLRLSYVPCDVWDWASALQPHSHKHRLTITCTCCYDEIKGTQDRKIYSHADSLILSRCLSGCSAPLSGCVPPTVQRDKEISHWEQRDAAAHKQLQELNAQLAGRAAVV